MRRIPILLCGLLLPHAALEAREPTELEQLYLEIVNRARLDPNAEVVRLSGLDWGPEGSPTAPDLNEGLTAGTISSTAKPPLAFDTRLMDSASDYADFLLATEQFSHTAKGTATSRMEAAGFPFSGSFSTGENLAITSSTGPHPVNAERVEEQHAGLFIDGDVPGRGHRTSLMNASFREVGIAIRADSDTQSIFGPNFNDVVSAQNFVTTTGRIFVTGVLYDDFNTNGFYDPGETAGIIDLTVKTLGGTTVATGRSFGSGGYSINLAGVPAGNYEIFGEDSLGDVKVRSLVWGGTVNVKVDFVNPNFLAAPVLSSPYLPDARIGLTQNSFTGNDLYQDTASGQSVRQTAKNSRPLTFHARVENDGSLSDFIRTTGSRGNRFFRVSYLRQSGVNLVNVTASLLTGKVDNLATGAEAAYRISIQAQKPALGKKKGIVVSLRSVSGAEAARIDRINAIVANKTKKPKKKSKAR